VGKIEVKGATGARTVALVFAAALAASAFLFATTGWGTPFPGCWPELPRSAALAAAAVQVALAAGFALAATRASAVGDPILVVPMLALAAAIATGGGVLTAATGVARFGKAGCIELTAPWSYASATLALAVGALAAYAAVAVAVRRGSD
jgi:hypothetical protein